jgi:hypothetical protein
MQQPRQVRLIAPVIACFASFWEIQKRKLKLKSVDVFVDLMYSSSVLIRPDHYCKGLNNSIRLVLPIKHFPASPGLCNHGLHVGRYQERR